MVNLGGTQKADYLGTYLGTCVHGFSITGFMQAMTSDGKSGSDDGWGYREKPIDSAQVRALSRLFGYLLW